MSQENVEGALGVRTPVAASTAPTRRTLDERVAIRFPWLARMSGFVYTRLLPGSRLRRAITARGSRRLADAFNRRDFDALLLFVDPQVKFEGAESLIGGYFPDLPKVQNGQEEYRRMCETLIEGWDDLTMQSEEVIDCGDRLLGVSHVTGRGRLSGIVLDIHLFHVAHLRRGVIVRQRDYTERQDALNAIGLTE